MSAVRPTTTSPEQPAPAHAWWGDRGVSTKILTAVGVAGVVAAGVGVMGLTALSDSADTSHTLFVSNIAGIGASNEMQATVANVRISARQALIVPTPELTQESIAALATHREEFTAAQAAYMKSFPTPEKIALVEEAADAFVEYLAVTEDKLSPLALANDVAA